VPLPQLRCCPAFAKLSAIRGQNGLVALRRRLHRYVKPALLVIDERGYLPYTNRYDERGSRA